MTDETAEGVLRKWQKQLDPEGIEVGVSRQALDEVLDRLEALQAENQRLREALTRLRDCDWVISLPDRMDAVREIAREALENTND